MRWYGLILFYFLTLLQTDLVQAQQPVPSTTPAPPVTVETGNSPNAVPNAIPNVNHPPDPTAALSEENALNAMNAMNAQMTTGLQEMISKIVRNPSSELKQFFGNMTNDVINNAPLPTPIKKFLLNVNNRNLLIQLLNAPNPKNLLIYDLVFLIFMFFVRSHYSSKLERGDFLGRFRISIWSSLLTFLGLSVLVPFLHYGQPYIQLLKAISEVAFHK